MTTRSHFWMPLAVLPLLLVQGLEASVLIDDFSLASGVINSAGAPNPVSTTQTISILGGSATRTFSLGAFSGLSQGQIINGDLGFVSDPAAGAQASLEYENLTADLSSTPFLRLDFTSINFTGLMEVALLSTSSPHTLAKAVNPLPTGGPTSLFLDVRGFSGYQDGFLNGITDVLLDFAGNDGPFFGVRLSKISFTQESEFLAAIPEPGATACIAGGLLAGLAMVHRARTRTPGPSRD